MANFMMYFSLLVIAAFVFCEPIMACSTTYNKNVHVHVYDCDEAENNELGNFIIKQTKSKRDADYINTCSMNTLDFLKKIKQGMNGKEVIKPDRVAGMFVYNYYTKPEKVFHGVSKSVEAIAQNRTYNLIVDPRIKFYSLMLLNKITNDTSHVFLTSNNMDLYNEKSKYDVLSCENLFYYLSKLDTRNSFSITLVDYQNSNMEYRFSELTDIGGIYKKAGP